MQVSCGVVWAAPKRASRRSMTTATPHASERASSKHGRKILSPPTLPGKTVSSSKSASTKSNSIQTVEQHPHEDATMTVPYITGISHKNMDPDTNLDHNPNKEEDGNHRSHIDKIESPSHEKYFGNADELVGIHVADTADAVFDAVGTISPRRDAATDADMWSATHALEADLEIAALAGYPEAYVAAFEIERQRRELADRADELRALFAEDVVSGARRIAHKCYGWNAPADAIPGLTSYWRKRPKSALAGYGGLAGTAFQLDAIDNDDDVWRAFRGIQAHEYNLEDPVVADQFFADLQAMMTQNDLAGIDPKIIAESYPWLDLTDRLSAPRKKLFSHPLLRKKSAITRVNSAPQVGPPQSTMLPPKPSIAKKRFEQDLASREAKIREELNSKFRANPVPASSLVPKLKYIMMVSGNKTTEMRKHIVEERLKASTECPKCQGTSKKDRLAICRCERALNPLVKRALDQIKRQNALARGEAVPKVALTAAEDGKRRRERRIENKHNAGFTNEHSFQPRITGEIPDYKLTQEKFYHKLEIRKQMHIKTKSMPFNGLESHEQARAQRAKEREERGKKLAIQEATKHMPKPTVLSTKTQKPAKTKLTHSWKLKVEHARLQREAQKLIDDILEQEKQEKEERKRAFAYKIRARIDKSQARESFAKTEKRRKQFVDDQKRRIEEHRDSIQEMNKRISTRMCLFEQEQIAMAKRKAKTEFQRILKESGVDM